MLHGGQRHQGVLASAALRGVLGGVSGGAGAVTGRYLGRYVSRAVQPARSLAPKAVARVQRTAAKVIGRAAPRVMRFARALVTHAKMERRGICLEPWRKIRGSHQPIGTQ